MNRQNLDVTSDMGTVIGYSRAVRVGDFIFVSGTTAAGTDGKALHPGDAGAQTRVVLERIESALEALEARTDQIVETKIYLTDIANWRQVGEAHGAVFKRIRPATTLIEVGPLIAPDLLVEISAIATF